MPEWTGIEGNLPKWEGTSELYSKAYKHLIDEQNEYFKLGHSFPDHKLIKA